VRTIRFKVAYQSPTIQFLYINISLRRTRSYCRSGDWYFLSKEWCWNWCC